MGWFVGYDGHFLFDNIGDSYIENKVPYLAFRSLPALMGSLTVPTVFLIMWESGYSLPAAVLASSLVLFDNSHIGQTRLILLDATLIFFMSVSVLSYVRFYKQRHEPFSQKWWQWMLITGFCMSCVISTKYVGAFTFFTIGCAIMIDLWDLLDINRKQGALDLITFGKHFMYRAVGFILVPFLFYLMWFQVHFAILYRSGPGDDFMTPEFQETLSDNVMHAQAVDIQFYDTITLRHKDTKVYLHSHVETYPQRYEDGRISSQGQQVTGYPFNDTNNQWQILPMQPFPAGKLTGVDVKQGDVVKLRHLATDTVLLSHDVASPYYPTNQEFTTVPLLDADSTRHNETLFEIRIEHGKAGQTFKSKSGQFKLIHHPSKVAMWTHASPLPEWAFKQAEINGNKNAQQSSNIWYVDDIPSIDEASPRRVKETRKAKYMPFLKKYFELQRAMFYHNNALTASHPYSSLPYQWPFLLRGVSFWTQESTRQQIYFVGNPVGYWITSALLAVFAGIWGADQLSLRRGIDALDPSKFFFPPLSLVPPFPPPSHPPPLTHQLTLSPETRSRFYNSTGFLFICWAAHYFPFYLMGRQLFLHHYLPAHLAACLVSGALVEFIFNTDPDITVELSSTTSHSTTSSAALSAQQNVDALRKKLPANANTRHGGKGSFAESTLRGQALMMTWAAVGVIMAAVLWGWWFFLPLTYGKPGLDVAGVNARKWLGYDLHFAK